MIGKTGGSLGKWARRIVGGDLNAALVIDQASTGLILDLQKAGVSKFSIGPGGALTQSAGNLTNFGSTNETLVYGLDVESTFNYSANGSYFNAGINNTVRVQGGGNNNSQSIGFYSEIFNDATGTITTLRGADVEVYQEALGGAVTNMRGLNVYTEHDSTALVTNMTGVYIDVKQNSTLDPVTNSYGIFVNRVVAAGDTDSYGLYIAAGVYNYLFGDVGIGTARPESELHVFRATAGTVTAPADSVLTLESDGTMSMTFLAPNNVSQAINFGDPENTSIGRIAYEHSVNNMVFQVNNAITTRLTSSDIQIAGAVNFTLSTSVGTMIATTTQQKLGFWGQTPSARGDAITNATGIDTVTADKLNLLLAQLRVYGLLTT